MEEPHARYYVLQIAAGLRYSHGKTIVHNDLHAKNVVLKYNPDGSKTCLLCDFGLSVVFDPEDMAADPDAYTGVFQSDVTALAYLVPLMIGGYDEFVLEKLSPDAKLLCKVDRNRVSPMTVDELMSQYRWFHKKVIAPFVKYPSPLLPSGGVAPEALGYLPEEEPAPGWSKADLLKRRVTSFPREVKTVVKEMRRRDASSSSSSSPELTARSHARQGHGVDLTHAAEAAVASDLDTTRSDIMRQRQPLGQRFRRSISSIRERLNCIARGRSRPQSPDGQERKQDPEPGPSGMQHRRRRSSS